MTGHLEGFDSVAERAVRTYHRAVRTYHRAVEWQWGVCWDHMRADCPDCAPTGAENPHF